MSVYVWSRDFAVFPRLVDTWQANRRLVCRLSIIRCVGYEMWDRGHTDQAGICQMCCNTNVCQNPVAETAWELFTWLLPECALSDAFVVVTRFQVATIIVLPFLDLSFELSHKTQFDCALHCLIQLLISSWIADQIPDVIGTNWLINRLGFDGCSRHWPRVCHVTAAVTMQSKQTYAWSSNRSSASGHTSQRTRRHW